MFCRKGVDDGYLPLDGPVHVMPSGDAVAHEIAEDCVCGPRLEFVPGARHWLVVHHSLDGRESAL